LAALYHGGSFPRILRVSLTTHSTKYEGESVNRSQVDIKRKTWYSNLAKTLTSWHILHQHWYACPITLPLVKTCSIEVSSSTLCAVASVAISTGQPGETTCNFQTSLREFLHPVVNCFTWQIFPTVNRKHFLKNTLCIESFCPQKRNTQQNDTLR
jgi:hypothetical protein